MAGSPGSSDLTNFGGTKNSFDAASTQGGTATSFDPYTLMSRAFRMQMLLNPGILHDMLGAMRTGGGGGSRLAALRNLYLPQGTTQAGVPVGLPGSSNLGNTQGSSFLGSYLPYLNMLFNLGNSKMGQSAIGGLGGLLKGFGGGAGAGAAGGVSAGATDPNVYPGLDSIFG